MIKMLHLLVKEANILIRTFDNRKFSKHSKNKIKDNNNNNNNNNKISFDIINNNIHTICQQLLIDCKFILRLYNRNRHLFTLIIFNIDDYLRRLRENYYYYNFYINYKKDIEISKESIENGDIFDDNKDNQNNNQQQWKSLESFYNLMKECNGVRNLCIKICIRHHLSRLAFEILTFTIPIIAFAAIIALSRILLEQYSNYIVNMLYSLTLSIVILPFVVFFFRSLVIFYIINSQNARPFSIY
jgi:hypothetical protein